MEGNHATDSAVVLNFKRIQKQHRYNQDPEEKEVVEQIVWDGLFNWCVPSVADQVRGCFYFF